MIFQSQEFFDPPPVSLDGPMVATALGSLRATIAPIVAGAQKQADFLRGALLGILRDIEDRQEHCGNGSKTTWLCPMVKVEVRRRVVVLWVAGAGFAAKTEEQLTRLLALLDRVKDELLPRVIDEEDTLTARGMGYLKPFI